MTYEEMKLEYDEKWIYLVNCKFSPYKRLLSGVPVIIGDRVYEGVPDGIYEQFNEAIYAPRCDVSFKSEPIALGFFPPKIEGMGLSEQCN
jgi:hypothetical protein